MSWSLLLLQRVEEIHGSKGQTDHVHGTLRLPMASHAFLRLLVFLLRLLVRLAISTGKEVVSCSHWPKALMKLGHCACNSACDATPWNFSLELGRLVGCIKTRNWIFWDCTRLLHSQRCELVTSPVSVLVWWPRAYKVLVIKRDFVTGYIGVYAVPTLQES